MARRILGIDPGSRKTGYGLVEVRGSKVVHVDNGVILVNLKDPIPLRLRQICEGLQDVIREYRPEEVAIESVFLGKNVSSALKLGQARGVALYAASSFNLPVTEFAPTEVKRAVVGTGRAEKKQVQEMVRILLGLPEVPQEDAADALAVAIAGGLSNPLLSQLTSTGPRRRRKNG